MKKLMVIVILAFVGLGSTGFTSYKTLKSIENCDIRPCINLDFTLTNKTGYDIEDIFVGPSTQEEWGDDIMGKDLLENGESVDISFDPGEVEKKWDIYVTWRGYEADEDVYWIGLDLSVISEITLYYDAKTGKTWAETK